MKWIYTIKIPADHPIIRALERLLEKYNIQEVTRTPE